MRHDRFRSASFARARLNRLANQRYGDPTAPLRGAEYEAELLKLQMVCASGFTGHVDFPRTYARWDDAVRELGHAAARRALLQCAISYVDLRTPDLGREARKTQIRLLCNAVLGHAGEPTISVNDSPLKGGASG